MTMAMMTNSHCIGTTNHHQIDVCVCVVPLTKELYFSGLVYQE